jgi:hypothetical protein
MSLIRWYSCPSKYTDWEIFRRRKRNTDHGLNRHRLLAVFNEYFGCGIRELTFVPFQRKDGIVRYLLGIPADAFQAAPQIETITCISEPFDLFFI